jgi:hypothetical protein
MQELSATIQEWYQQQKTENLCAKEKESFLTEAPSMIEERRLRKMKSRSYLEKLIEGN